MKSLITSILFTLILTIGSGSKAEAERLFDAVPEHVQFQNKLIEDVFTINADSSVGIVPVFKDTINKYGTAKQNSPEYAKLMKAEDDNGAFRIIPITTELSDNTWRNNENVTVYKVDYSGGSRYFPSSAEGQAFMRKLNNNYQNNLIPNPGNVTGYYTSCLQQGLIDYSRLLTSTW